MKKNARSGFKSDSKWPWLITHCWLSNQDFNDEKYTEGKFLINAVENYISLGTKGTTFAQEETRAVG
jgi:hypothetical protein